MVTYGGSSQVTRDARISETLRSKGIHSITNDVNRRFRMLTTTSPICAFFYQKDPSYGTQQGIGAFN